MAYKITYTGKRKKGYPRLLIYTAAVILAVFALQKSPKWEDIRSYLLPCRTAVVRFVEELQAGEDFSEAVAVFCQELIHGEN